MSDFLIQDYLGDFETDRDTINYTGAISMSAKAGNRNGELIDIGYYVDVEASASYEWETDEQPTGWNHSTDNPTYSSYSYASASSPEINSITFTPDQEFYIDNNSFSLHDAQGILDPSVMKQLLNPVIYVPLLGKAIDKKAENLEPPEVEEPDDYYDWDDGDY